MSSMRSLVVCVILAWSGPIWAGDDSRPTPPPPRRTVDADQIVGILRGGAPLPRPAPKKDVDKKSKKEGSKKEANEGEVSPFGRDENGALLGNPMNDVFGTGGLGLRRTS